MSRFRDFDLANAERKREPVTFQIRGRLFELPPELPAIIPVEAMRLVRQHGTEGEIPDADQFDLALKLLGKSQFDDLLALEPAVSIDELGDILKFILSEYTPGASGDSGNSKAPAENAGEPTS